MNISDFGAGDSLKKVLNSDFGLSTNIINQEIYEEYINVFKYPFVHHHFIEEFIREIDYILPKNKNLKFDTKELYWQAYVFFKQMNYSLFKSDCRSQILHIKSNYASEMIYDNSVRCVGKGWDRNISYKYDILSRLDEVYRFYWYFPYLNNPEIQYCYLFELAKRGIERAIKRILEERIVLDF